jgi:gamma-glutamyltranspeptidase/glutathione hydrolase
MHTMISAMVYQGDKPVFGFGVMGGQYLAMGQAYVLSNWIDYGMDVQASLLYDGELSVEQGIPQTIRDGLSKLGHSVIEADSPHGGGQAIYIDWENGVLQGGSDSRKDGHAAGF